MSFYLTHTGEQIDPSKLDDFEIKLEDIAHHLSKINRFGGALPMGISYTVAQHSLHLAEYAFIKDENRKLAAALLLHDAAETYLGDVVSPLKAKLSGYKKLESVLSSRIFKKYKIKLAPREVRLIDSYDKRILLDEAKRVFPGQLPLYKVGKPDLEPLGVNIMLNMPDYLLKEHFLNFAEELGIHD